METVLHMHNLIYTCIIIHDFKLKYIAFDTTKIKKFCSMFLNKQYSQVFCFYQTQDAIALNINIFVQH